MSCVSFRTEKPHRAHEQGQQTTYISSPGDFTGASTVAAPTTTQSFYFLTAVEVRASERARAIVTLGDSVTEGFGSTPDMNQRYPNHLAERLQSYWGTSRGAVLNAGISGNRVLHDFIATNALARFDRDVLVQTGVKYVIVLEGNADFLIPGLIGNPAEVVAATQIIQAHGQMIDRAHAMGLRIYGGTLNPVEGYPFPGFWTPDLEAKRQAVNQWIGTSHAYDAVLDFDKVLRDPSHPSRLLPAYDGGDHGQPNDVGYKAMADAIDLSLFVTTTRTDLFLIKACRSIGPARARCCRTCTAAGRSTRSRRFEKAVVAAMPGSVKLIRRPGSGESTNAGWFNTCTMTLAGAS